eukprot:TRINITY_DN58321_c0_g1_i1.p3 TRINITY_DN58321_c0_g1~~TRINITY_DN58321_c0_g1_i1.p3  ORF type:complete len:101 (+),score=32.50 TRINITY_DN58321_c0_g1_i1:136-438(+)
MCIRDRYQRRVHGATTKNDDIIEIVVKDTGIGIAKEKHENIFMSFEQGDGSIARKYGGTGIGLSITKQLVELHGGNIKVCLLYTSPSPRDLSTSRMPSSA